MTSLVLIFSKYISLAFVKEAAVAEIVSHGLKIISIGYLCYMITSIFSAKLSGIGKVNLSMILMFVYYIAIRVPLAAVFIGTSLALDGMWIAILVSHLAAMLIAYFISRKGLKRLEAFRSAA